MLIMKINKQEKIEIKRRIVEILSQQPEIEKIIIFGSFMMNERPTDIDIAVFQNSNEDYLTLALKYRKLLRDVSKIIPIDIIPLINERNNQFIQTEIVTGEIIYEKSKHL